MFIFTINILHTFQGGMEYYFCVIAENSDGQSEPLVTEKRTRPTKPPGTRHLRRGKKDYNQSLPNLHNHKIRLEEPRASSRAIT